MPHLVSIIIPTYNRAHLIGETLDSILAQTYTKWECIVVDDGFIVSKMRMMCQPTLLKKSVLKSLEY
ncbi:glycosyltransferase family 2 protein [Lutibacter sp.]